MMQLVSEIWKKYPNTNSKIERPYGMYQCPECFGVYEQSVNNRKPPRCRTCSDKLRVQHGESNSKLHGKWGMMKQRCYNPKHRAYADYGKRGISVCDEWKGSYLTFKTWCLANGYDENSTHTLDRRDNNKGYSPDNCRFVTRSVQQQNTRLLSSRNTSGYRGVWWVDTMNKFVCVIGVGGKRHKLGYSSDPKKCARMFDAYVKEHSLEHPLNFPDE